MNTESQVNPAGIAADDAALLAQGAALDDAATPPPVDPATGQPVAPVDYVSEARDVIDTLCAGLEFIYSEKGLQFSDPTRARLAAGWAPVMEKYGLSAGGLFGEYRAEIGAAIVTVPVIMAARKVINAPVKEGSPPQPEAPGAGLDLSMPPPGAADRFTGNMDN